MATREQMSLAEQLMYSTVRVECVGADTATYIGTGNGVAEKLVHVNTALNILSIECFIQASQI